MYTLKDPVKAADVTVKYEDTDEMRSTHHKSLQEMLGTTTTLMADPRYDETVAVIMVLRVDQAQTVTVYQRSERLCVSQTYVDTEGTRDPRHHKSTGMLR